MSSYISRLLVGPGARPSPSPSPSPSPDPNPNPNPDPNPNLDQAHAQAYVVLVGINNLLGDIGEMHTRRSKKATPAQVAAGRS